MNEVMEWIIILGVPTSITGFLFWCIRRKIEAQETRQLEREKDQQQLILMMMQTTRANNVGIEAIARAVQRIPDAHCNGDMETALKKMSKYQAEEKEFLLQQGIKHIFDA